VEQDHQLLKLEQQGFSASLIGEQMGKTREAVIGRSYRLRGYKTTRKNTVVAPRDVRTTVMKTPIKPRHKPRAQRVAPDLGRRMITIFELDDTTCKWPFGDRSPFLFCGAPRDPAGKPPYCAQHLKEHFRS
jgi:hypothetical protein